MKYAQVHMQQTLGDNKGSDIIWGRKTFTFSCNIPDLEKGDYVICKCMYGYVVTKFENYTDKPFADGVHTMPVVCKVDLSHFEQKEKIISFFNID